MELLDSKMAYKAPQSKVIEVKIQGVLCSSPDEYNQREDWEEGGEI